LPRHLVLFALWKAAVPAAGPSVGGPKEFRTPADARLFLEASGKTFVSWAAGRAIYCELEQTKINPKMYDSRNGKGMAEWAVGEMRRYVEEFKKIFEAPGEALAKLEKHAVTGIRPQGERVYPPGRKLMDELFAELNAAGMPPYFRPAK